MTLSQGSSLSLVCFNEYALAITKKSLPPKFDVLTFADDVLVIGTSIGMVTLERERRKS